MASTAYTFYESAASVDKLDKNTVECQEASEFPRGFYKREPLNPDRTQPVRYMAQRGPRDLEIDYFFGSDRLRHPDHHSRFGYPWCPNGYCTGNHPGRYNTAPAMMWQTSVQPPNMAPERFYHGKYIDPNYVNSEAYITSFAERQVR